MFLKIYYRIAQTNNKDLSIHLGIIFALVIFGFIRWTIPERPMDYTGQKALLDSGFVLGLTVIVFFIAGGIGFKILKYLDLMDLSHMGQVVFGVALGLGIISYGVMLLGMAGLLRLSYIVAWLVLITILAWRDIFNFVKQVPVYLTDCRLKWNRIRLWEKAILLGIVLILFLTFLQALTPPWDYDGLMYHLEGPRRFINAGSIYLIPEIWQSNGPLSIEMLFIIGLLFGSDSFSKIIHLLYAILLFLGTYSFGQRLIRPPIGWMATIILIGIPAIPLWASFAYIDMGWGLYELLSLYALVIWISNKKRSWLVMSGIMLGIATGTKYLALSSALVLMLLVIWRNRKSSWNIMVMDATIFGVSTFLLGAPWYIKNLIWSGNPIYPLYFGGLEWPAERVDYLLNYLNSFGVGKEIWDYVLLPWNIYAHHGQFTTFLGSIEIPSLLFILILLYPLAQKNLVTNLLVFYILMRFIFWSLGSQQIRFLLPLFPPLSVVSAWVLFNVLSQFTRPRVGMIVKIGLLGGVIMATILYALILQNNIRPLSVILGFESKNQFLSRTVFDFDAIKYLHDHLGDDELVMMMWDGQGYYCGELCLPDAEQSGWTQLVNNNNDIRLIAESLNISGITHLLFSIRDADFLLNHDSNDLHYLGVNYFLKKFQPACTSVLYNDKKIVIYKLTC